MCTGRVDLAFVLRAFSKGADGVFIGGCRLNECNYTTHGNYYALRMTHICKKMLGLMGLDPERLRTEFISSGEGNRFAELMNEFSATVRGIGPLGEAEGIDGDLLRFRLDAAAKLVPYIKLLERERFRVQFDSREAYDRYFGSEEFDRLFAETVGSRMAMSQIVSLLRDKPLGVGEIADTLGLTPSEVSQHLGNSSRHGLVRYDEGQKRYALA